MEVLVGPTFSIGGDVPSNGSSFVVPPPPKTQEKHQVGVAQPFLFLKEEDGDESPISIRDRSGIHPDDLSDSSSSIGAPDDSDADEEEEDDEDGVVSSKNKNVLCSLNSLEDALPIKRGLSNHFSGKSKSFTNLSEVNTVNTAKELEKPENPFNKRRRILIANKWSRRSFYSWSNPKSMPLLTLHEDDGDDDSDYNKRLGQEQENKEIPSDEALTQGIITRKLQDRRFTKFGLKSQSCFSLSDLQEDDEEDDDDV